MRPVMDSYHPDQYPPIEVVCPRCGEVGTARFAGPCTTCIANLRDQIRGEAVTVDIEYVPKVNVTANAVAQKDD